MGYDIDERDVGARIVAAERERVRWNELGVAIGPMIEAVYAFLATQPHLEHGHNVCIYRDPTDDDVLLEVGVEVDAPFAPTRGITCVTLPAGRAAHTVHSGEYTMLGAAHDALITWARMREHAAISVHWEIYGDWADDPAERRTDVFRQIA